MSPRKAPNTSQEAEDGTQRRRADLETLRSTLLAAIEDVRQNAGPEKQAQLAPLTARLIDTLNALDRLPQAQASAVDDLKRRRAARASGAAVSPRSARKVVGGTGSGRVGGKRGSDPGPVAGTGPARSTRRGA